MLLVLAQATILQVVCTRLCQCQRIVEFSVRKQPGVGSDLATHELQLQTAIEIDPQLPVLAVTHRVFLSAWHKCTKYPCFSGFWRKSHAKPAGFIWEMPGEDCPQIKLSNRVNAEIEKDDISYLWQVSLISEMHWVAQDRQQGQVMNRHDADEGKPAPFVVCGACETAKHGPQNRSSKNRNQHIACQAQGRRLQPQRYITPVTSSCGGESEKGLRETEGNSHGGAGQARGSGRRWCSRSRQ